jgi:hypothetical protein
MREMTPTDAIEPLELPPPLYPGSQQRALSQPPPYTEAANNDPHRPGNEAANNVNTTNAEGINTQIQSDADVARRVQLHYALARFEAVAARLGIPIDRVYERVQDPERREYKLTSAAKRAIMRFGRGDKLWYEEFIVNRPAGAAAQATPSGHASGDNAPKLVPAHAAGRLINTNPVPAPGLIATNPVPAAATGPATSGASAVAAHGNGTCIGFIFTPHRAKFSAVFYQVGQVSSAAADHIERTYMRVVDNNHYELLDESEIDDDDMVMVIEEHREA